MSSSRLLRRGLLGAILALTVIALSGCGIIDRLTGSEDVFNVSVGDCLADDALGGQVSDVQTISCDDPHMFEVFDRHVMDDGPFPGDSAVGNTATEYCQGQAFTDFVGMEYATSAYYTEHLVPTEDSWNSMDDREILCLVYEPDTQTTGTLQGAEAGQAGGGGGSDSGGSGGSGGSAGTVSVYDLQVGHCMAEDAVGGSMSEVELIPCDQPHYYEVIGLYQVPDGPFPGQSELGSIANSECQGQIFSDYINHDYATSEIWTEEIIPSEDTWNNANDREIVCLGYDPDTQITGSLEGAGI